MTILDQLPEGARVCIIRLRSLGDCVLTTPALALLKQARPDLQVGVVVAERFRAVFERNSAVTCLLAPSWKALRDWRSSLCVNLHGGTQSQFLTAVSGAKWRAGFAHHRLKFAYNFKIARAQEIMGVERTVHTAEHLASAFFALGVPVQEVPRAQLFAAESRVKGKYAVLHPFASAPDKQWPAERFCEVARYLKLWNITPVFLAAQNDDVSPFAAHQIFRDKLSEVKEVLSKAVLFIGNDSGPAHIAAAFGVPSLVLFGASDPAIWGPWRTQSQVIVARDGLTAIKVSRVIAALERLRILEEAHA